MPAKKDTMGEFVKENRNQLKIALDVDQVIADSFNLVVNNVNNETGAKNTLEDLIDYPAPGKMFLNVTNDDFVRIYDTIWNSDWKKIPRLADKKLLLKLCSSFDVDIVSSRGEEASGPLRK